MTGTQKAIVINKIGGTEVLELVKDFPIPTRASGQVLVRLRSASVNPVDTAVRAGRYAPPFPKILGGDLAGVVEEADEQSQFKKGDLVAALTPGFFKDTKEGTYAQYVAVPEDQLAKLPEGVDVAIAGGIPLVALTAWQALHAADKLKPGARVLVLAASGGVGHFAVQLAKALGAHVVGVAGPANAAWVKDTLGADEVVDYSKQDYAEVFAKEPFDIVVDVLPDQQEKILSVLKPDGHWAHILNAGTNHENIKKLQEVHAQGQGPAATVTFVEPNGKQLREILELVAKGKVKLEVAKVFPLAEVADAHKQVESGHTRGKVVLAIP